jgi:hypothetical protein
MIRHMNYRLNTAVLLIAFVAAGCGNPTSPSATSGRGATSTPASTTASLQIGPTSPSDGSTIHVTVGAAPGLFMPREAGQISIPITAISDRDVPWAQLNVYLMTGDTSTEYCGQNLPDIPGWVQLTKGQQISASVTGFQVYRLPCDVVAIRAYLTTRDTRHGGVLTPPKPDETIATGVLTAHYQLRP